MLPAALGVGEGGSFRSPMATAVIGGLIVSTGLSLIFVPSFYVMMDDVARLFSWVFKRFVGKRDEPKIANPDVAAVDARVTSEVKGLVAKIEELQSGLASMKRPVATTVKLAPAAE